MKTRIKFDRDRDGHLYGISIAFNTGRSSIDDIYVYYYEDRLDNPAKPKRRPAEVNWCAMGSVPPKRAIAFAKGLLIASAVAHCIDRCLIEKVPVTKQLIRGVIRQTYCTIMN